MLQGMIELLINARFNHIGKISFSLLLLIREGCSISMTVVNELMQNVYFSFGETEVD